MTAPITMKLLMTAKEVAEALGVDSNLVYEWHKAELITSYSHNSIARFDPAEVLAFYKDAFKASKRTDN